MFVGLISLLQESLDEGQRLETEDTEMDGMIREEKFYFLPVFFVFYRFNAGNLSGRQCHFELGVFGESTRIAQKWIFLVIIYGSKLEQYMYYPIR